MLARPLLLGGAGELSFQVDGGGLGVAPPLADPKYVMRQTSPLSDPTLTRTSVVACGLHFARQACGFNALMYYSATLFKKIVSNQSTAVELIVSRTNFLFTLFALKYIDIVGRRRILLWSMPGMIFGFVLASVAFHCTRLL